MTAEAEVRSGGGLFGSLRRLGDTLLDIAQVRLELFGSELEQEKLRLFDALLRGAIGLVLLGLALVLLLGFVVMLFWDGYRLGAVGVLTLIFGAAAAWLLLQARQGLKAGDGGPFALTLGELRRDRASLAGRTDAAKPPPGATEPPAPR